ncbi:MAG: DUF433 domain-containing protein [Chloroflexi bacterium]|nr:DUF433 domain-containing protein [Chloroflexota bacterium]
MLDTIADEPTWVVPLRQEESGRLVVGESRVPLETVIGTFNDGATPEEIVFQFPTLHLEDVYSTVGYYLYHTEEIERYLHQRQVKSEQVRRENEARFPQEGVRARLLKRRTTQ